MIRDNRPFDPSGNLWINDFRLRSFNRDLDDFITYSPRYSPWGGIVTTFFEKDKETKSDIAKVFQTILRKPTPNLRHRCLSWIILCEQWARRELRTIRLPALIRGDEIG